MAAHEQSVGKTDEWYTPRHIFSCLAVRFDMDVAAPVDLTHVATPTDRFIHTNSLAAAWDGFVWMNPPFGPRNGLMPWLSKFFRHGNGIALTPDRTSAPWWHFAAERADAALFLTPKVQFVRPDGSAGKAPGTGTCLWAAGSRGKGVLRAAADALGVYAEFPR